MSPPPILESYTSPPASLINLLTSHLPHSLPLLRRLQFCNEAHFPGGITENSRVLYAAAAAATTGPHDSFVAAYVDLSRGPETQLWLYGSLEADSGPSSPSDAQVSEACDQALCVLREVRRVRDEEGRARGSTILIGALSERMRTVLVSRGLVFPYYAAFDQWNFELSELPDVDVKRKMEDRGLRWGKVRKEDIGLVLSRTKIPRKEYVVLLFLALLLNSRLAGGLEVRRAMYVLWNG